MSTKSIIASALLLTLTGGAAEAQSAADPTHKHTHPAQAPSGGKPGDLAAQVEQLKAQVASLQAAMGHPPGGAPMRPMGGGMGRMPMGGASMPPGGAKPGMGGMGMMDDKMMGGMMGMGAMGAGAMPSGGMGMGGMMGCCAMMGQMSAGGPSMAMSALPGFSGASHLYHIGETGFFLDHPEHITLTEEQAAKLGKIREDAIQARGEFERKIAAAEEELWQLTAADQPAQSSIEAKTREIGKLRGDQRLAFIRAVGEAAKILTDDQRKSLLGQLPPSPNPAAGMGQGMSGGSMGAGGMMMDDQMQMPPQMPSSGGGAPMGSGGGMGDM